MPASNGGIVAPLNVEFVLPGFVLGNDKIYYFDPTNFNDANSGSIYSWKVEDVWAGRTPTCSRVILTYTDLGVASLFVNLSGTNDEGQAVNSSTTISIGNTVPLGIQITTIIGISLTAQNLQLDVVRAANGGPVSIAKVRLEGRVEMTAYA